MSQVYRSQKSPGGLQPPSGVKLWIWICLLITGLFTWLAIAGFQNSRDYKQGEEAFKTGDCQKAIAKFDQVIHRWVLIDGNDYGESAKRKKGECHEFQNVVAQQTAGNFSEALFGYNDLMIRFPTSDLIPTIQTQTTTLLTQTKPATLAEEKTCKQLGFFWQNEALEKADQHLLPLYLSCGQYYAGQQQHTQAVAVLERFLAVDDRHELASEVKTTLAKSMIAEARQQGAAEISPPVSSGSSESGYTVVEIQNDSPAKLNLVLSGPETRFEEIPPCRDCEIYPVSPAEGCPNKGPISRYTFQPGVYDLVIKSVGEHSIIPFTSTWTLDDSVEYRHCFVVVEELPEEESSPATEPAF